MTIGEAINYLLKGDLISLNREKSAGITLKHIFIQCINCGTFPEVEKIAAFYLGLTRHLGTIGNVNAESEEDFRARVIANADPLDNMIFLDDINMGNTKEYCSHNYTTYQGLFESYEFCVRCNERKE